jgi:diguanylate cyclase (GGDEF)-like protein
MKSAFTMSPETRRDQTIVNTVRDKFGTWAVVYTLAGAGACLLNLLQVGSHDLKQFLLYLLCANVAVLGLRLMAGQSLLPAGFLVLLLGVEDLSLPELLFIAFTVTLLGELQKERNRPRTQTVVFAVANVTIGLASAQLVYRMTSHLHYSALFPLPIIASSFVLLFNYGLARTLVAPGVPLIGIYRSECRPLLPWFIAAAYLAYLVRCASLQSGVHAALIALPILFALDRGSRAWSDAKEGHAAELALLHQRTLETLSVVINARDHSAHQHLRRVQVYARALGRELGMSVADLEDLHVATLVYNIGQLGVPDHILLKPGTLTQEEWEKVKTHPMTGSEMLSRMNFPPGVRAIVQTHHEKWNGDGYPEGLKGEQIPIGARILAAVDCLDALASDRPFRRALPIAEAMAKVGNEAGKGFDPRVVSILERRYMELENKAREEARQSSSRAAPSAGAPRDLGRLAARLLVESESAANSIVNPIVSARQETQLLQVLASDLASSAGFEEIAAAAQKCLAQIVNYDTLALYVRRGENMVPVNVLGRNGHRFSREPVAMVASLSGRSLCDRTPILNGSPRQELSYVNDAATMNPLQSALAMPLEGRDGVAGVLTLYHVGRDAFSRDHLRFVKAAGGHIGVALEGALRYQDAENLAGTDHLTGVANNRSLALHLERELSRASREKATIGVLLCDLNGFKQVNDRFGHLRGNEVLQHVARGLKEICRSSDYLARMGGDEFVVVVPGPKEDLGSYVARLEAVTVEAGWAVCGEQCLSMSVGMAIYPVDGDDPKSLLAEADRRMYQAKDLHKKAQHKKDHHKRGKKLLNEGAATGSA